LKKQNNEAVEWGKEADEWLDGLHELEIMGVIQDDQLHHEI
jgi:hypothetical protein